MHGIDAAVGGIGGGGGPERGVGDAEAHLLAFHVAGLAHMRGGDGGIALPFRPIGQAKPAQEQQAHHRKDRPALAGVLHHAAEGVGQRRADHQDGPHLHEIGQAGGILEGMRRIDVEEAAAIGAQHLDRFLRSHRPLRDQLLDAFQAHGLGVGAQILRHALPHQEQRHQDGHGQQHIERAAGEIDPEIAHRLGGAPRKAADQRQRQGDAGGGADRKLCTVRPSICTR